MKGKAEASDVSTFKPVIQQKYVVSIMILGTFRLIYLEKTTQRIELEDSNASLTIVTTMRTVHFFFKIKRISVTLSPMLVIEVTKIVTETTVDRLGDMHSIMNKIADNTSSTWLSMEYFRGSIFVGYKIVQNFSLWVMVKLPK